MINNPSMQFSVDDFIKSLNANTTTVNFSTKVAYSEAVANPRFVKSNLGTMKDTTDGSIWKLETAEDGRQYIVRTEMTDSIVQGSWAATPNRTGSIVTLAYKNVPIQKFAMAECGFDNADRFAEVLIQRASGDSKTFIKGLLATLPFEQRIALQKQFADFR